MSANDSADEHEDLEGRLIAASSRSSSIRTKAEEMANEAEELPEEHKKRLSDFSGRWTEDNVQSHLNELERIVREPRVTQSEDLLESIGISRDTIETIKRDVLQNYTGIEELVNEYEQLEDEFGEYVDFLVEDDLIVEWLREDGPVETKHRIEIDSEGKFHNIVELENIQNPLKLEFFKQIFLEKRSIEEVQDLDDWVNTLGDFGVDVEPRSDVSQYMSDCESAAQRAKNLQNEFGYSGEKIQDWIGGKTVEEAKEELQSKIDEANRERDRLQRELEEYCRLLGKDAPDIDSIPQLEDEVKDIYNELTVQIGDVGEQLLDFLRGKRDELPEADETDELLDAIQKVRPLLQRRFEQE